MTKLHTSNERAKMKTPQTNWNKKFWIKRESQSSVSNYWLRNSLFDRKFSPPGSKAKAIDTVALAKYKKAISNFVYILTQRNDIIVKFNTRGQNWSTGSGVIQLSPNLNAGKFDAAVGLALHEASHLLYTDFDQFTKWHEHTCAKINSHHPNLGTSTVSTLVKTIFNFIEDRYIDAHTYRDAPGYRGYYSALYIEYFGNDVVNMAFYDPQFQKITLENYIFHIINMTNPNRNVKALPGLDKIITLINLPDILRLHKPSDRENISQLVIDIIIDEVIKHHNGATDLDNGGESGGENGGESGGESGGGESGGGENAGGENGIGENAGESGGENGGGENGGGESESAENETTKEELKKLLKKILDQMDNKNQDNDAADDGGEVKSIDLTPAARKKIEKIIKTQLDVINGEIAMKGTKLSIRDSASIDAIESTGVNIVTVSDPLLDISNTQIMVVDNVNTSIIGTDFALDIGILKHDAYRRIVQNGILKGRVLASKLKFRNEDRSRVESRLKSGKIDKRLLAEIGFDNYDVFHRTTTENYNQAYIHLSLDASGSMAGNKWSRAIEVATILATASTLIPNVRVVVTTRSSFYIRDSIQHYIATVFDSNRHGVAHIRTLFSRLATTNTTPEGLCFAAILKSIIKNSSNTDAYFINVCDGEPSYANGVEHTRNQRMIMERHGIKILGYFVDDRYSGITDSYKKFIHMYGQRNTTRIDSVDIGSIARTMNVKLLEK